MIWLTQMKCPNGHTVVASPWDDTAYTLAQMERDIQATIDGLCAKGVMNPVCNLCTATTFHFETKKLPFKTVEEAMPLLQEIEMLQVLAGELYKHPNLKHNKPKKLN